MVHGVTGFFLERARAQRRVSLLTLGISLLGFLGLLSTWLPPLRLLVTQTVRFGYEGPDQYVKRIQLQQLQGPTSTLADLGQVLVRSSRRGGADRRRKAANEGQPVVSARFEGPGQADSDLPMRAIDRLAHVPMVRSEELVIDRLVRPQYPQVLLDKNIEGKVTVQALIDTVGRVVDVLVLASTGETQFERAAEEAVWQCRFRPYRHGGATSEVYAVFRFTFRIY